VIIESGQKVIMINDASLVLTYEGVKFNGSNLRLTFVLFFLLNTKCHSTE